MSDEIIIDTPENWDAASLGYSVNVAPLMMEPFTEDFIDRLDVNQDMTAIEVAAGSGAFTEHLARRVRSVLATDFSPGMLEINKERTKDAGLANVNYEVMDGQKLMVENSAFDRALCCFGLMFFQNRVKGFSELARALKPEGRALVSGWADKGKFKVFGLFMEAIKRAFPDFQEPEKTPPVFRLADLDNFKNEMEEGGFIDVDVDYVSRELVLEDFESFWKMLTIGAPPVRLLIDKVGDEGLERIHDALSELVNERFGAGPLTFVNTATVGCGNVP